MVDNLNNAYFNYILNSYGHKVQPKLIVSEAAMQKLSYAVGGTQKKWMAANMLTHPEPEEESDALWDQI